MTTFVGRERELAKLRSLLKDGKRLLTLVGIGGIGKTRLALELGFGASQLGFERVYLAELASLANPGLVESAVLESLGGGTSRSPLHAAVEHLREESALLVLDSCEHVLEAARQAAALIVRQCPSVAVLATSRSPLDIAGELVWQVPPLSIRRVDSAREAQISDAAWLFADRASYAQPGFELTGEVVGAAESIVRRVDGIPSQSSLRQPGCAYFPPRRSPLGSTIIWDCYGAVTVPILATRPSEPRLTGVTSS
jgi:predicted ATPase